MCLAIIFVDFVKQDARYWYPSSVGPPLPTMFPHRTHRTRCPANNGVRTIFLGDFCVRWTTGGGGGSKYGAPYVTFVFAYEGKAAPSCLAGPQSVCVPGCIGVGVGGGVCGRGCEFDCGDGSD